jgi:predicted N-acetyltransferase YhbS
VNLNIRLENLLDHKDKIHIVARWLYNEFCCNKKDVTMEYVIERLENRKRGEIPLSILALINNIPVGVVSIFKNDLKPREDLTPWLAGLYVDKEYRNQGIAKLLITEVIEIGKKLGYDKIYLRTEHAAEYYKKLEWQFVENTVDEYGQQTTVFQREIQ